MTPTYLPTPAELVARGFIQRHKGAEYVYLSAEGEPKWYWGDTHTPGWMEIGWFGRRPSGSKDAHGRAVRLRSIKDFDALLWMLGVTENHPDEQRA